MPEQKKGQTFLIGLTLFSMFFGAGNLIFPPFLGVQAGGNTWPAFAGFAMSAIGFPILGVIAVARSGGLSKLAGRVHPRFAFVFTILIYLSIGPCLAIPRTASTSFEMAVTPFTGSGHSPQTLLLFRALYSLLFFAAALFLALRPEKLTDRLGKILCPALLLLIFGVFAGCLISGIGSYGVAHAPYDAHAVTQGFIDGYQTMDTIAALNFGIVISLNLRARGVTRDADVVRGTVRAGWIAGALFVVVYAMLTHIGALSGGVFPAAESGAQTLTSIVTAIFGRAGAIVLAAIFVIACFNTCVGLISSCSEFFAQTFPALSYKRWAVFFTIISACIANIGLREILLVSLPVLQILYPVSIVLIALSFFQKWIGDMKYLYPTAILFTGAASVLYALSDVFIYPKAFVTALYSVPFAEIGLGWIIPALVGLAIGAALSIAARTSAK